MIVIISGDELPETKMSLFELRGGSLPFRLNPAVANAASPVISLAISGKDRRAVYGSLLFMFRCYDARCRVGPRNLGMVL